MKSRNLIRLAVVLLVAGVGLGAQQPDMKQKFAQAQKSNAAALRQFTWKSRTEIQLKGETKKVKLEQVLYDASGKQQKTLLEESPQPGEQQSGGGRLKKKVVAKKKEEFADTMQNLVQLATSYANIPPEQMQIFIQGSQFGMGQGDMEGTIQIAGKDAVQAGDAMRLWIDKQTLMTRRVEIDTALEKNPVHLVTEYQGLPSGPTYQAKASLEYPKDKIKVLIENTNYQPLARPAAQASVPASAQQLSPEALDKLLAPVALYPDALLGQVLMCSMSPFQVGELGAWLKKNPNLKGSAVQDAAQKEGFDPSFVALASFPQVVNMMAGQMEWTRQLGQAFVGDRKAVMESVQRLRAQAMAAGTLKDTPQQDIQTQTTQSGQQVIVVQPANPQIIYVPQYNPQTVYVTPPPQTTTVVVQESSSNAGAAAVIGFTAGVILGAAVNDNYWGPYGMYEEAWDDFYDHREDMAKDYYEHRENMAGERTERQGTRQEERTERQGGRQENTSERQTGREENRTDRQTGRDQSQSDRQAGRQEGAATRQGERASATGAESRGFGGKQGQATQDRSGTRSGAFSGYESGSKTRESSARGRSSTSSSSRGSGRSGGGRRR